VYPFPAISIKSGNSDVAWGFLPKVQVSADGPPKSGLTLEDFVIVQARNLEAHLMPSPSSNERKGTNDMPSLMEPIKHVMLPSPSLLLHQDLVKLTQGEEPNNEVS